MGCAAIFIFADINFNIAPVYLHQALGSAAKAMIDMLFAVLLARLFRRLFY